MAAGESGGHSDGKGGLVWDLPVRLFHWGLVLAVIGAFVTHKMGVRYFAYHAACGYAVLVLVAFRILWGFVGTYYARFVNFVRGPGETLRYFRTVAGGKASDHVGHNPLGAAMVVLLLGALGVQAGLGLFSNDDIFNYGPFSGLVSPGLSQSLSSIHRKLFYAIALAIGVHVLAVLWHQFARKEDLVRPMITGRKPLGNVREGGISSSRLGFAVFLVLILTGILAFAIGLAPAASGDI